MPYDGTTPFCCASALAKPFASRTICLYCCRAVRPNEHSAPTTAMDNGFDPLTGDAPGRARLDEDDEAEAEALPPPGEVLVTVRL